MKTIAICDSSKEEREELKSFIKNYFEKRKASYLVLEYQSAEEILYAVEEKNIESAVIFLDIYLKGKNGMEVAFELRKRNYQAPIVFLANDL